jgi:hypothetical protein
MLRVHFLTHLTAYNSYATRALPDFTLTQYDG